MKTVVEILRAARARIDAPERWWDGHDEHDHIGLCAWVAIEQTGPVSGTANTDAAEEALARAMVGLDDPAFIAVFNDTHTHAEVMAAFDVAIANEEAREQEHDVAALAEVEPEVVA